MQLGRDPSGRRRLGRDVEDVRRDEGAKNSPPPVGVHSERVSLWGVTHWWRDDAAVAEGEYDRRERDGAQQVAVVVRMHQDDQDWSNHGPQSVTGVGHTETASPPFHACSNEQGDEREVNAPETDTHEEDGRQESVPVR